MTKKLRARVRGPPYQKIVYLKIYSSKFATPKNKQNSRRIKNEKTKKTKKFRD